MRRAHNDSKSIAFFVYPVLRFPRNNREYFLTKELISRGWSVTWLLPKSGVNEGVPIEEHVYRHIDLDYKGRTYLLPIYLGFVLRANCVRYLWLSGWSIRSEKEIYWLIRIMRLFGVKTIYDPIDPIYEFGTANMDISTPIELSVCKRVLNRIYGLCTKILCVTPEMKVLLHKNGAEEAKLFVARWGVDSNLFIRGKIASDFRKKFAINDDKILIGWLGSMTEFKGLKEMIIPLMGKLSHDKRFHFLIAGDGPLYKDLKSWIESQYTDSITLAGRVPYHQAANFTVCLDIYLVTTDPYSEYARAICPVKCYDAVAMRTPLITTRTPATEHLTSISNLVYLCDYDFESFEKCILKIASEIEQVRQTSESKIDMIVSHQNVSIEIADMLDELCNQKH